VVLLTAQQASGSRAAEWEKLVGSGSTLVIYMPGKNYSEIGSKLRAAGLEEETPCALISRATTPLQRVHRTSVGELRHAPHLASPMLLVVGEVVRFADAEVLDAIGASGLAGDSNVISDAVASGVADEEAMA
jgi:uroporphyrin-III C-methyltransferase